MFKFKFNFMDVFFFFFTHNLNKPVFSALGRAHLPQYDTNFCSSLDAFVHGIL